MAKKRLGYCPDCAEYSTHTKIYGDGKRVEYCINTGCGWRISYPSYKEIKNASDNFILIGSKY